MTPEPIASYEIEIAVPSAPPGAKRELNKAWGYPDGEVNRPALYAAEPALYGLGRGSLVPAQWPEPEGFQAAHWRLAAGAKQRVTVHVYSDGSRRIVV